MGVVKFAGFSGETQVRDGRDLDVEILARGNGEAGGPCAVGLVLQVEGETLVLEVCEAGFGWKGSTTETTGLNPC